MLEDTHLPVVARTEAEAARIAAVLAPPADFSAPEPFEARPGGAATAFERPDRQAFSQPSANMAFEQELDFRVGSALFDKLWVSSPASTKASDGLGPLYNARACLQCHVRNGRGHPPESPDDTAVSMVMRVSLPGGEIGPIPGTFATQRHPRYGGQIHDFSTLGVPAEGRVAVEWEEFEVALSGGETARLRRPAWALAKPAHGALEPEAMLSPRMAPPMIGLGLLEAIPAEDILAKADPEDADGDGISGRVQIVWSREHERPMLGRFGHKAIEPTLREQVSSAFHGDMGLSTPLHLGSHGDCTASQDACLAALHGGVPEVEAPALEMTLYYSRNLAVPARRGLDDPEVLRGKRVFHESGCASCHTPKHVTHRLDGQPEQSFQLIWPYTDLLLHDMGEGLADHRPEGRASGREWRTPPLWGIGLTETVNGHTYFLHDGRARSLLEAILWHGGEAAAARERVVAIPPEERAALIRFLESL
ncbi:MAG: di-heme oxidoredictase family protein [Pseudomonadota bacterium]